jgi:hypothetical protein
VSPALEERLGHNPLYHIGSDFMAGSYGVDELREKLIMDYPETGIIAELINQRILDRQKTNAVSIP